MKNITFNFLGVNVINQSIKFFTIFLLAFNVFAGGDDRDKEYYEGLDQELATFEARLDAELAAAEMMAEIFKEEELAKRLAEFQAKVEAEKAAAAASTAAYQSKLEYDAKVAELMDALEREMEIEAFEAQLEAELAAQEMMAEIIADEERAKRLAEFQAALEAEKAAAAASTAAYQAKLAEEKAAAEAAAAAHEACKYALNLSASNIALFESALADGSLFNVGPQLTGGTEFTANRWDEYANCVSNYVNPF